jgi:zinc transport system substrate-binding protein
MKSRYLSIILAVLLVLITVSGCSTNNKATTPLTTKTNTNNSDATTVKIVASFYPMYIMLMNITMDMPNIKIVDMTQPTTGCLHDYTVTPDDMKNLEGAQFFVINGAGMESFMDKVVQQFPKLKTIDSSKNIALIKGEGDEGDNPHLWVSISNAILQVKNIEEQLSAQDSSDAVKFKANTDAYVKKLEAERDKMHQALDGLSKRDIITFHEAFPYFAKEFNLNIVGVIEREPGSEPSAKELSDSIASIKSSKVQALFAEPQYPATAADTIAQETGLKVYTLDPAVTGPVDANAYLDIMDSNLKVLQEALK